MRTFFVEVDTNDADYIGKLVHVSDEKVEKWMPLIEKIKNFKPYTGTRTIDSGREWNHSSNFPIGECCRYDLGEKDPMELYGITEEELDEFRDIFGLYGGEYGFHTINQIVEIEMLDKLI
jgi:hypothetical protein